MSGRMTADFRNHPGKRSNYEWVCDQIWAILIRLIRLSGIGRASLKVEALSQTAS
jgi:hypothetical protein